MSSRLGRNKFKQLVFPLINELPSYEREVIQKLFTKSFTSQGC